MLEGVAESAGRENRSGQPLAPHLLKTRDFGLLFSGQLISQIGDSLNKVALLWFVYELTGSALKMTAIGLLQTVPPLVFGPLIGVYLDRLSKKRVMIWVDVARTFLVLLIPFLYALDALTLEILYVLVFVIAVVSTVFGPALASAVPLIVRPTQLTAANALLQGTANIGMIVGPAVSGLGIVLAGAQNVLYLDAATFLISALCLIPIRVGESRAARTARTSGSLFQELTVGFRFVFVQHRTVFTLMLIATLYSLGTSAFVFLLPVFAKELLRFGPLELGLLWSALGGGMLAASAWLAWARHSGLRERMRIVSRSMAVGGLAVCGLSVLETPLLATLLIMVIGGSTAMLIPVVWGVLQELTPNHLLGRVFTAFSTGGMSSAMAGMAGFGWAADAIGPTASLLGISLILFGTATVAAQLSRRSGPAPSPLASR
ncbi:MAG: MFS transporter [Nitrospirota bacterium]